MYVCSPNTSKDLNLGYEIVEFISDYRASSLLYLREFGVLGIVSNFLKFPKS